MWNKSSERKNVTGCYQSVFEENALQAILNPVDGTPRMINKFCIVSLLIGESHKTATINTDIVMQVINDTEL